MVNDRFAATFTLDRQGIWEFTVEGCVDAFATWRRALERKQHGATPEDVVAHLRQGAAVLLAAAARAAEPDREQLLEVARQLDNAEQRPSEAASAGSDPLLLEVASRYPAFEHAGRAGRVFELVVEPKLAGFSAWYEFFPRSTGAPGGHGTFRSSSIGCSYAADMGFDVLYLPPIHPIGQTFRKGKNNASVGNDGRPWQPVGHWLRPRAATRRSHPQLGTLATSALFVRRASELGIDSRARHRASVLARPSVCDGSIPSGFAKRPDGTIQYAENPPKKYQDIYPFDFESADWRRAVGGADVRRAVLVPTRACASFASTIRTRSRLPFWDCCIAELKGAYPDAIFLAEAFTRPKLMYALAKLGFTQSYTYFTWRNTKAELTEYLTELTQDQACADFFRPNFWPNTPDILPEHLQYGGRAAFMHAAGAGRDAEQPTTESTGRRSS